ncbi:hypothetical protein M426DRAFT_11842 [Hypoxylon sp. CI-4A]|nr:hypothetical protein M426DRAFT_11842 [Hypoxylon sp. CI-4A]
MAKILLWILAVSVLRVSAAPSPRLSKLTTKSTSTTCAEVSSAIDSFLASNPSDTPVISGSLAYDCLRSVPNRPQPAQQLITSLKAFVQWQTTLAWLKNPPQSYTLPPVDIQGGLDNISSTVQAGGFASEYDFQLAIVELISSAHDGHFYYLPDVFKAFTFENNLASDIVSVSANGTSLPRLYRLSALQSNSGTDPVAISEINGQDATSFMMDVALKFVSAQDMDAQWNTLFPTYSNAYGNQNPWAGAASFLGPNLTLTYEDGSTYTEQTMATLNEDINFSNINTGDDYYEAFCVPPTASNFSNPSAVKAKRSTPTLTPRAPQISDYPTPLVKDSDQGTTMGFFLDGEGYDDVAVLAISAFSEGDADYLTNFQSTVEAFLNRSRSADKQRLVIDLTSNGGGFIAAGFELFAQLFPDVDAFNANVLRASDSLVSISRILASLSTQDQLDSIAASDILGSLSPLDLKTPDGGNFSTVDEVLGPVTLQDDRFTAYARHPLQANNFNLTGTGSRSDPPPAVFEPENIVLLTDGNCGSTCTIFSYLMIFQAGVKTVTVGGRPQLGPMQSIGGTEGSQVIAFNEIAGVSAQALGIAKEQDADAAAAAASTEELSVLAEGYAVARAASPDYGSVNFKSAFAPSDASTPLQFAYEPANCRFFYTAAMISSPELVWRYAVGATWLDPDALCVQGSMTPVNTTKTLDPAFRTKNDSNNNNNTTTDGNGDNGTDAGQTEDDDDTINNADRTFGLARIRAAGGLAMVLFIMLFL